MTSIFGCERPKGMAGPELREDRRFVLQALQLRGAALEHVPHFQAVEELVLAAVASNSEALRFSELRSERPFALRALSLAGRCHQSEAQKLSIYIYLYLMSYNNIYVMCIIVSDTKYIYITIYMNTTFNLTRWTS